MRVLLTVHQFLPEHEAGTEVLTLTLARQLRHRGHEVTILTGIHDARPLKDDERFDGYTYDGFEVHRFRHNYVPMGGESDAVRLEYDNPLSGEHFRRLLRQRSIEVVHFLHLSRHSARLIDVAREEGVHAVMTATDYWAVCPLFQLRLMDNSTCAGPESDGANCVRHMIQFTGRSRIGKVAAALPDPAFKRLVAFAADHPDAHPKAAMVASLTRRAPFLVERLNSVSRILVPTQGMRDVFARHGVDPSRLQVAMYGIDWKGVGRCPPPPSDGPLKVAFIGTISQHKGIHVLLDAIVRLPKDVDLELQVYGRLEENPHFAAQLLHKAFGDRRIRFQGTFPNAEIGRVLAGVHVVVLPSIWVENAPLVLLSAKAAGRAVIASDVGGMRDLVQPGVDGLLTPPGDATALSFALARLAWDRGLVLSMCRSAVAPPTADEYAATVEAAYAGREVP